MSNRISRRDFINLTSSAALGICTGRLQGAPRNDRWQDPSLVSSVNEASIRDFISGLHGSVIRPTDKEYDASRRIWNAKYDRFPGLIVRCVDASDVRRTVQFAHSEKILVAVRGGGHSFAGHSTCDGGLVIDLSRMKGHVMSVKRKTVRAQPGLTGIELDERTQRVGLALVLGGCGTVGIGGFTLGGGEGSLSGKYGLSCDNLLSAEVVTADGRLVTASADENTDLFWALRGGGGNFGVVTSFLFRAHPLTNVVAGRLIYDVTQAPAVMRAYRDFASTAPDELTTGLTWTLLKDGPAFLIHAVYAGNETSGSRVLRNLRRLGKPKADTIAGASYLAFKKSNIGPPSGFPSTVRTAFVRDLPNELIDVICEIGARIPPAAEMEMFHLHGRVSRVSLSETAFPLRDAGFDCFAAAAWLRPDQREPVSRWVQSFGEILSPHAIGAYVNMLNDDEANRVRNAYGKQYIRLAALKKRYDPNNLFRLNPNITPAT
jgi:FAD/FMN-containing dehydrogenase